MKNVGLGELKWLELLKYLETVLLTPSLSASSGKLEFSNEVFFNSVDIQKLRKKDGNCVANAPAYSAETPILTTADCISLVNSIDRGENFQLKSNFSPQLCKDLCALTGEPFGELHRFDFKSMLVRVGLLARSMMAHFYSLRNWEKEAKELSEIMNFAVKSYGTEIEKIVAIADWSLRRTLEDDPFRAYLTSVVFKTHLIEDILAKFEIFDEIQFTPDRPCRTLWEEK